MTRRVMAVAWSVCVVLGAALALCTPDARAQERPWLDPLGAALWAVPGEGRGLPATDGGSVYFLSRRHELLAVDAATGRVRWRASTGGPGAATSGQRVVVAGSVAVAGDGALAAFDRSTGAPRWRFAPRDGGFDVGAYLGAAAQGVVLAGSRGGRLYAVDAETGRERWSVALVDGTVPSTVFEPEVDAGLVAAAFTVFTTPNTGGVAVIDLRTGRTRWRTRFPMPAGAGLQGNASGGPVFAEGLLLASRGDGVIHAFHRSSGALAWTLPALDAGPLGTRQDARPLALAGPLLVAGSSSGVVAAYDLVSRRERWRYTGQSGSVAFAVAADGRGVFVPYVGGRLVALDARTGVERWRIGHAAAGFVWPPLVLADRLIVVGSGAGFYALRR